MIRKMVVGGVSVMLAAGAFLFVSYPFMKTHWDPTFSPSGFASLWIVLLLLGVGAFLRRWRTELWGVAVGQSVVMVAVAIASQTCSCGLVWCSFFAALAITCWLVELLKGVVPAAKVWVTAFPLLLLLMLIAIHMSVSPACNVAPGAY